MTTWAAPYELRKIHIAWSRAPVGVGAQDVAMTTLHLLNLTSDAPDATWTDTDFTDCESLLDAWWGAIKSFYPAWLGLDYYRWYKDGPAFHPTPAEGNAAVRLTERAVAGTGSGSAGMPPQVAVTVTEKTAIRKRWGRMYLPAPSHVASPAPYGLIDSTFRDALADATETLYNGLRSADFIPVVFSPTTESAYSVDKLQVDDLYDVIRSRRYSSPSVRDERTLTAI